MSGRHDAITQEPESRVAAQERFLPVFGHLGFLVAYARRRGAADPEALAAEAMTIAWRKLGDVPRDDPRPWLIATARNLLLAERRKQQRASMTREGTDIAGQDNSPLLDLDPRLEAALRRLTESELEALLLRRLGGSDAVGGCRKSRDLAVRVPRAVAPSATTALR